MMEWLCFNVHKKKKNNCFRGTQPSARFHPGWMQIATLQSQGKGFPIGALTDAHSAHRGDGEHVRTEG